MSFCGIGFIQDLAKNYFSLKIELQSTSVVTGKTLERTLKLRNNHEQPIAFKVKVNSRLSLSLYFLVHILVCGWTPIDVDSFSADHSPETVLCSTEL